MLFLGYSQLQRIIYIYVHNYMYIIGRAERALLVVHQPRKCLLYIYIFIYDRPTYFYVCAKFTQRST